MSTITVTSTANAGMMIDFSGKRLWVDALHNENTAHYSVVTDEMLTEMFTNPAYASPDFLLFTHAHNDHFSRQLVKQALLHFPKARVLIEGSKGVDNQIRLKEPVEAFSFDGLSITFFKLTHDGKQFESTKHYGILLENGTERILIPGDCRVASEELFSFLSERGLLSDADGITLGCLNFPWVALGSGRDAISKMNLSHTLFIHMPYEADDTWGYRKQVLKSVEKYREDRDWRVFNVPFQTEVF